MPAKCCPMCGSTNLRWLLEVEWSLWECPDCGYRGGFVIEDGEMAEEIRKKRKNTS